MRPIGRTENKIVWKCDCGKYVTSFPISSNGGYVCRNCKRGGFFDYLNTASLEIITDEVILKELSSQSENLFL